MTNKNGHVVVFDSPNSSIAEAYRGLRTNLLYRNFDEQIKVINVVSINAQEGKSTTVVNLAGVFSQLNKKVLVIDLDLKYPSIHKKIKVKNAVGVTDVLTGQASITEAIFTYAPNMDVLLSGKMVPFSSEIIQSEALVRLLQRLEYMYDLIIIDCPPIGLVADGIVLSNLSDGTLLVCASGRSERRDLIHAKETLKEMNVNVLGVVFTRAPISKRYGYYSKYGYGYGYYASDSIKKKSKKSKK